MSDVINPAFKVGKGVKFNSMWSSSVDKLQGQDLSNVYEDTYTEIPAYAKNPDTGEFLNDESVPKLVYNGKVNIQEKIQSFAKETDIYCILERFAYSGDSSLLNARECQYGDISMLPNNLNDYTMFVNKNLEVLKTMDPELARLAISDNVSIDDINNRINELSKSIDNTTQNSGESEVQK